MKTETVEFEGIEFEARSGTHDIMMLSEIFDDRYYTCDGWDVPDGAVVLDIGGGIGGFAAFAAAHGAERVYTFEPISESFELLLKNTEAYPCVWPEQAAVALAAGNVQMSGFAPMADGTINTGLPGIIDGLDFNAVAVGVHDVLAVSERWDVVKIDIEGYEYELLGALTDDEFAKISMITMEFHHDDEATTHRRGLKLAKYLESKGFTTEVSWAWGEQGRLRARK